MKKGFTLVEIMIVVAIIALLAAIAIPNLLRAKVTANEAAAQATLKTISTCSETYAAANNGLYPTNETNLTSAIPPYLGRGYCGVTIQGYNYACTWSLGGYLITAGPQLLNQTGTRTFSISTGGVLSP